MFAVKLKWFNDVEDKVETVYLIVSAVNYAGVVETVANYYDDGYIVSIEVEGLQQEPFLEFTEDDEFTFNEIKKMIDKNSV